MGRWSCTGTWRGCVVRLRTPSCWPLPPLGESVLASVVQHTVWPARLTHHHGGTQAVRLATVMEEAKRHGIALPHGTPSTLATHKRMKCVILAETLHVVYDDVGNRKLVRKGPPPLTAFLTFISRQIYISEVINPHTVGYLTIPRASIKCV